MKRISRLHAWLVTVGAAIIAVVTRFLLDPWLGDLAQYAMLYLVIAFAALLAGWQAAVVTALLAGAASFYLMVYLPGRAENRHLVQFALYASLGLLITALAEWGRRQTLRLSAIIAELKQSTEALRTSEKRLATFMHRLPGAAWIKDLEGHYIYANPEAERIFGISWEQLRGKTDDELFPPETARQFRENDSRVAVEGGSVRTVEVLRQPDGMDHYSIVSKFNVAGLEGRPAAVAGVAFDITDRMKAEEALTRAKEALEKANAAKDQFFAVLSHELRTPLSPVFAAVQLLDRSEMLSKRGQRHIEVIRRNIELEARLIDDLLDLTRIVQGKISLERSATNICTVLERVAEICKVDIEAKRIHFRIDLRNPPHSVCGDTARLQQIIWNLLNNSIKFTPEGGCVGIKCYRDEGNVVIEVLDSGRGIAPDMFPRIFNAFEQGEIGATRQFGGLGLGLTISKRLVELHGGRIEAESAGIDKGAAFRVILPAAAEAVTETEAEKVAVQRAPLARKILLVEDHADTAAMMQELLQISGYEVKTAPDVAQALEATSDQEFDLLISDLGLPDRSGIDLMHELRRSGSFIRGIALSGFGREEDIKRSKEAGFYEHLTKPVDIDALLAAVHRVL